MSLLFCVVVMSHVVGPFLQFSIHVVVQRLCSRFRGCCYNVFHGCCGSHSSSLLRVVLFLPFFTFSCSCSKILLKFSWLLLFMISRLPWEPLYIIIVCIATRSFVVIFLKNSIHTIVQRFWFWFFFKNYILFVMVPYVKLILLIQFFHVVLKLQEVFKFILRLKVKLWI